MDPEKSPAVLVVEDDEAVRDQIHKILDEGGYRILQARNASEAFRVEAAFPGDIALLLTDMTIPDLAGPDLAKKLKLLRPSMRVMLMSGYPDGDLLVLNYGWHFVHKSLLSAVLLDKIKDLLTGTSREQSSDHFDTRV